MSDRGDEANTLAGQVATKETYFWARKAHFPSLDSIAVCDGGIMDDFVPSSKNTTGMFQRKAKGIDHMTPEISAPTEELWKMLMQVTYSFLNPSSRWCKIDILECFILNKIALVSLLVHAVRCYQ